MKTMSDWSQMAIKSDFQVCRFGHRVPDPPLVTRSWIITVTWSIFEVEEGKEYGSLYNMYSMRGEKELHDT